MAADSLTRVMMMAAAVDSSSAGIWATTVTDGQHSVLAEGITRGQVMDKQTYGKAAKQVDKQNQMPAIASPRTNFEAPSIAP